MKKRIYSLLFTLILLVFTSSFVDAESCNLNVNLLNQDPYPAVASDYAKIVFSVSGITNPECGEVYFQLIEDFPISFDNGVSHYSMITSGGYASGYSNQALVPFRVRIDKDVLDKEYEVKVRYANNYKSGNNVFIEKKFNLTVKDYDTLFEVSVKDYDYVDESIDFEIINIGKHDVNSLTIDLENQESLSLKGSSRSIIGSLDSNDDTSFSFFGIPKTGEITLKISYNDEQNVRRVVYEKAYFDESLYSYKLLALQKPNYTPYYVLGVILLVILIWVRSYFKRKKKLEQMKNRKA